MKIPRETLSEVRRLALLQTLCRVLHELVRVRGSTASLLDLKNDLITGARDLVIEATAAEDIAIEDEARILEDAIEDLSFAFEEVCHKSA